MATKKSGSSVSVSSYRQKSKVHRKGVVAKTKESDNKGSKNYKKPYRGQGKQLVYLNFLLYICENKLILVYVI